MRVIAGKSKGRRLLCPRGLGVRPTSDRVRESLFAILGPLDGAKVLDLFAGAGTLGIEALSRGASRATFVEIDRAYAAVLGRNVESCGLAGDSLVLALPAGRALDQLERRGETFDLVLLDPPYESRDLLEATLGRVGSGRLLAPGARVAAEHPAKRPPPERSGRLLLGCRRAVGQTAVSIYESVED